MQTAHFDGATYAPAQDHARLTRQLDEVFEHMKDGVQRTLSDIASALDKPQASISARLRDLRKEKFGGHTVERKRISKGVFGYSLIVKAVS